MSSIMNGPIRKSLASQLDRFDGILDTLAEGLNEAVATVVEQAVATATQAAVKEVLTNPALQQRLRETTATSADVRVTSAAGGVWAWLKSAARAACGKVVGWAKQAWSKTLQAFCGCREAASVKVASATRRVGIIVRRAWSRTLLAVRVAGRMRKALLAALAAGVMVGLGCYWGGPLVSSVVSGFAGFVGWVAAATMKTLRELLVPEKLQGV